MQIFDSGMTILEKTLDVRVAQDHVTTSNITNADTPGYVAQKLDFNASLDQAMRHAAEALEPGAKAAAGTNAEDMVVNASAEAMEGLDGNNVDMEGELGDLARNKMMYSVTTQIMAMRFRQIAAAITPSG